MEAKASNNKAQEYLISKYENFVKAKAKSYFLIGADKEAIYQFQDTIRTDYHSRKGELETLRRMVLEGKVNSDNKQNFMAKLRELISPESYQMEKFDEEFYGARVFLLDLMGKDVLIDSPRQMIKK